MTDQKALEAAAIALAWIYDHGETPGTDWPISLTDKSKDFWRSYANDAVSAYLAALSKPEGEAVAVKSLEWTGQDTIRKIEYAYPHDTGMPCYSVKVDGSGKWWRGYAPIGGITYLAEGGDRGAKAAVQSHYDACIRSALHPAPDAREAVEWQPGERDIMLWWLPKLIAKLGAKPDHIDDVMRLERLCALLSPAPVGEKVE